MTVQLAGGASSLAHLEWWVPVLDGGPFSTVDVSVGAGYTGVDLAPGWYLFPAFLDALLVAINAAHATAYTWSWYTTGGTRLLQIDAGEGDPAIAITWSASMADLLGFNSGSTPLGEAHRADTAPDGLVDVRTARWCDPMPLRETHVTRYRYGRLHAYPWGSGTVYRLTCICDRDGLTRLLEGPMLTGRTRVHQGDLVHAMTATWPGGYLDGYVTRISSDDMDGRERWYQVAVDLLVPPDAERTTGLQTNPLIEDTSFWGWTRYGFSVAHYARLQGIPVAWSELDFGWSESHWTWTAGLVLDGAGRIGYEIDRRTGVGRSASLNFGLLDPDNAWGLFRRPTIRLYLAEALEHDDADVVLQEDATALPSSGRVFLGFEVLEYASIGGLLNNVLEDVDVKRGMWGPAYTYAAGAVPTFASVTDAPVAWMGRQARVTATLVDPYGRPVDAAPDGDHSRDVFLGELDGDPQWSGEGRWDFTAHSLERRLTRPIGAEVSGRTVGLSPGEALRKRLVYVEGLPLAVDIKLWNTGGASPAVGIGDGYGGAIGEVIVDADSLRSVGQIVDAICQRATHYIGVEYGYATSVWADPEGWEEPSPGVITARIVSQGDGAGFAVFCWPAASASAILKSTLLTCHNWPYAPSDQLGESGRITIDTNATTTPGYYSVFVREAAPELGSDPFPASGYAVVEGSDGDELVRYDQKTAVSGVAGGHVYRLRVVERQVDGTPAVALSKPDQQVRAAQRIAGAAGEVMLQVLQSSGWGIRGTYDVLPIQGQGYGLSDDVIDEASILDLAQPLGLTGQIALVLGKEYSANKLFGGLLASRWLSFSPVCGTDGRLRIGLVRTDPVVTPSAKVLTDAHLMGRRPVTPKGTHVGPTTVEISLAEATVGESKAGKLVFRSREAIAARTVVKWDFEWHGVGIMFVNVLAVQVAKALLDRAEQFIVVEVTVGPWHAWQAGDAVVVTSDHPGMYDYGAGSVGVAAVYGRVLAARRATDTAQVTLALLLDGAQLRGVLCPGVQLTGRLDNVIGVPPTLAHLYRAGESVTVYTPGNTGAQRETLTITDKTGGSLTVSPTPAGWVGSSSVLTYQDEDAANGRQAAYIHIDDGSRLS